MTTFTSVSNADRTLQHMRILEANREASRIGEALDAFMIAGTWTAMSLAGFVTGALAVWF